MSHHFQELGDCSVAAATHSFPVHLA